MRYLTVEQREALRAALERVSKRLRSEAACGPLPNHNEDTDDEAVADLETSLEVAERERAEAQITEIEAALERLHTPDFGVCETCDADIPYVRLLASPTATRCIACQRASELESPAMASL
jgi:RNA polymerase-binding protein DksA